ncbi:hypothetical protein Tco_0928279 [Tanacetum coccineum]
MSARKQNSDEYHQESFITIQHCSFFIRSMDLYGTVLAYFKGRRIKVSAQQFWDLHWSLKDTIEFKDSLVSQAMGNRYANFSKCLSNTYYGVTWEGLLLFASSFQLLRIPISKIYKDPLSSYMTIFPDIQAVPRDMYHNFLDDQDEGKLTEHYRMTPRAPRSPNPDMDVAESSAPRRSIVIRLRLPERRSARLTPPEGVNNENIVDDSSILGRGNQIFLALVEPPEIERKITDEVYELKRREKGKNVEETSDKYTKGASCEASLPATTVDGIKNSAIRQESANDPHDDAHLRGRIVKIRQKTSEYEAYVLESHSLDKVLVNRDPSLLSTVRDVLQEMRHHFQQLILHDDMKKAKFQHGVNKCVKKFILMLDIGVVNMEESSCDDPLYIRKGNRKKHGKPKEPDYKNLNKNDIEDIYLLIINGKSSIVNVQKGFSPHQDEIEYLKLFEEEIESIRRHTENMGDVTVNEDYLDQGRRNAPS